MSALPIEVQVRGVRYRALVTDDQVMVELHDRGAWQPVADLAAAAEVWHEVARQCLVGGRALRRPKEGSVARIERAHVTRISVAADLGNWLELDFDEAGRVSLRSDWIDGSYCWPFRNRGEVPIAEFLVRLSSDYVCGKMLGDRSWVLDVQASVDALRESLLQVRRSGDLSRELAREAWGLLDSVHHPDDLRDFLAGAHTYELCDAWEYNLTRLNPAWTAMWQHAWEPHVQPLLRQMARGATAPEGV